MEKYEIDIDGDSFPAPDGSLVELATLDKYLHDPALTNRFIFAAANSQDILTRTKFQPDEKGIDPAEFVDGGYKFFEENHDEYASEFEDRLAQVIDPDKMQRYLSAFRETWIDGLTSRQHSDVMMQIKASIRDHDRFYFPLRAVFVNAANAVPEGATALFSPQEMHEIFDIAGSLANTCVEDYLASRPDSRSNSINRIYLHRGIFPANRIDDSVLVEQHYLTSYSMAVTVPEVFAQTWSPTTRKTGEPAMLGAPFPLFQDRIVMFAPFIRGMKLGQLEVCVAPPLELFPLRYCGSFPSGEGELRFHEYEFDQIPPGARWTGPLPARMLKSVK